MAQELQTGPKTTQVVVTAAIGRSLETEFTVIDKTASPKGMKVNWQSSFERKHNGLKLEDYYVLRYRKKVGGDGKKSCYKIGTKLANCIMDLAKEFP